MTRSGYERDPLFTSHDISDLSIAESKQVVTYPRIDEMDIVPMVKHMEARERAMVILRYMWGMTNREIGFLFGVDETIISKLISEAIRSLSSILKMQ